MSFPFSSRNKSKLFSQSKRRGNLSFTQKMLPLSSLDSYSLESHGWNFHLVQTLKWHIIVHLCHYHFGQDLCIGNVLLSLQKCKGDKVLKSWLAPFLQITSEGDWDEALPCHWPSAKRHWLRSNSDISRVRLLWACPCPSLLKHPLGDASPRLPGALGIVLLGPGSPSQRSKGVLCQTAEADYLSIKHEICREGGWEADQGRKGTLVKGSINS